MKDNYTELMKCNTPAEFVNYALNRGAKVRCKNHYCVEHFNGQRTVISCTPKKKIPLHKTRKEYKLIYLDNDE